MYIGLRVNRYGPEVTNVDEALPGTVVVRAFRKVTWPQPAIAAPAASSTPPAIGIPGSVLRATMRSGQAYSAPTPTKYDSTKTHGTGTCIRRRSGLLGPFLIMKQVTAERNLLFL